MSVVRIIMALAVAALFAGCASYSEVTTTRDGVRTEKKFSGWTGSSAYGSYYDGVYVPRRIYGVPGSANPATGVVVQEGRPAPVLVHRVNTEGQHYQSIWMCPGGYQAGKDNKC